MRLAGVPAWPAILMAVLFAAAPRPSFAERDAPALRAGALALPGLFRSQSALPPETRVTAALGGGLFAGSDFIHAGSSDTYLSGALAASWAATDFLDAWLVASSSRNESSLGTPPVLMGGTDAQLGVRAHVNVDREAGLHLATAAGLSWSAPVAGADGGSGVGWTLKALSSLDLAPTPAIVHLEAGYRHDPGEALLGARAGALPVFALGLWRWDVFAAALAAEAPLGRVSPFVEVALEVPLGGGAPFSAFPSRLTPGLRVGLAGGLALIAGAEIGLTRQLREGIPMTPPFLARLAVSYSGFGAAPTTDRAPPPASVEPARSEGPAVVEPPAKPPPAPAIATLKGTVTDLEGRPLSAALTFPEGSGPLGGKSFDASPAFEIVLPPGEHRVEVSAPGFLTRGRSLTARAGETIIFDFELRPVPEVKATRLTRERVEIRRAIQFATGQAVLLPGSFPVLDEVVDVLLRNPQIRKVRIEGHTDEKGTPEYNVKLSESRAFEVMSYLIEKGVETKRLDMVGLGRNRPIASNRTEAGRKKNRRVQFEIVEQ